MRANYLASPMLVVAYALAGSVNMDLHPRAAGLRPEGKPVLPEGHLAVAQEIAEAIAKAVTRETVRPQYGNVFDGDANWSRSRWSRARPITGTELDLCAEPALFRRHDAQARRRRRNQRRARAGLFGDSITTDHISPAGNIKATSPGGIYLTDTRRRRRFQPMARAAAITK